MLRELVLTEFKGETLILQPGEFFQLHGWQSFTALREKADA